MDLNLLKALTKALTQFVIVLNSNQFGAAVLVALVALVVVA